MSAGENLSSKLINMDQDTQIPPPNVDPDTWRCPSCLAEEKIGWLDTQLDAGAPYLLAVTYSTLDLIGRLRWKLCARHCAPGAAEP